MTATVPRLSFTAAQLLERLRGKAGTVERPPGSNMTPFGQAVGVNGVPWCAIFIAWGFDVLAGAGTWATWWKGLGTTHFAYTPALYAAGERAGLAVNVRDARPGDLVFFDFPDNVKRIQHVGVVVGRVDERRLRTIEGNTSSGDAGSQSNGGGVYERIRAVSSVVGVIRPPYYVPPPAKPKPVLRRLLRRGATGDDVKQLQYLLAMAGGIPGGVVRDGIFGPATERAVRIIQARRHLHVDGIAGPATARALGFSWQG